MSDAKISYQIGLFPLNSPLTKKCPLCGAVKAVFEFPSRSLSCPRPGAYCRPCQRSYNQEHYKRNAKKHHQRRQANQRRYKVRNRKLKDEFLIGQACVDCGEADPIVLEFDHVRGTKQDNISTLIGRAFSWKRILEEVAKCEVRCANCHRRKTAVQFWSRKFNGR